ncbi:perosamine synthetase [Mycobacterium bohemicum DSM 44277]|uniref:Perosamine synthetase n=2 Tax=Mycobacterium bohemicum TaxID=56425 RepID=A0A0U0W2D2_MYCBE|nr:perosamine synthetase [Mycobacterium bohemicum DSM 44277]
MKPLYVARPLLPCLQDLTELLGEIWSSRMVTNEGPLHNRLEAELAQCLNVPVAKLVCNGTVALQCALLSLNLSPGAEVITTPLTFPATAHAIAACGYKPVFADICEETLTLDPRAVERAITSKTEAVIGVHVYGTFCDVEGLDRVCMQHGLKLLFDAAHAFAAVRGGTPAGAMGDLSTFSLHATKLFNTFEGGLITSTDEGMAQRLRLVRNFGIVNEERVTTVGINGKMNEVNAAIGLLNLKIFEEERDIRRALRAEYDRIIDRLPGLRSQIKQPGVKQSEQFYMVVVDPRVYGATRDEIYDKLKEREIFSRRYFWPICTDFDCYKNAPIHTVHAAPIANKVKDRVLCLPFHSGVEPEHIEIISDVLSGFHCKSRKLTLQRVAHRE